MTNLNGRIALVTGGSRGIGAATAQAFANRGATVLVIHRDSADDAAGVVESLPGTGHRVIRCDLSSTADIQSLRDDILQNEGRLSYLINNAGWTTVVPHADLDALSDEIIEKTFQVNTIGVLKTCRELAPVLRADRPGGAIVNVSSVAARTGMGSSIAYCASKLAVESITQTLARVFSPHIRVLAVAPGLTRTALATNWTEEDMAKRVQSSALKRIAEPEEVVAVIVHMAADFTYATGSTVLTDGGRMLY